MIAVEGDSAFGFSGMEVETICRYNLPVCIVVMNNNGVYKGTDVDPTGPRSGAHRVREGRALRQADGGLRRRGRERDHAGRAAQGDGETRSSSRKPTLINAVIDETAGTESGRITSLNPTAAKKK